MAEHTPGPWEAIEDTVRARGSQRAIADCGTWHVGTQDKANARLIAAAPDLLDALKAAVEWIDPDEPDLVNREECAADLEKARAAIAKAEGR